MQFANFDRSYGIKTNALTLDVLQRIVPSAFATEAHSSRSTRYEYIPTSAVIEAMMREGFQPVSAKQGNSRIEGKAEFTKHLIRFRHPDMQVASVGDTFPEVVLLNSHDGTSAYKLFAGLFRVKCMNGLIVADSTIGSLSVPHKGNIADKVIEGSFQIVDQSRDALAVTKEWGALQLTNGEKMLFAEAAHTLRFADADGTVDTPITAAQLVQPRRADDYPTDLYTVFNRVQENAIRGGLQARAQRRPGEYRGRMVTTREVKGIDQDVKLNRALWMLAEGMAALKTGHAVAA